MINRTEAEERAHLEHVKDRLTRALELAIERHGRKPMVVVCRTRKDERERLLDAIASFRGSGLRTMGIICKTHRQAERLHAAIRDRAPDVHLLTSRSTSFVQGVVVCAAHLAKGLEFDSVIVPFATDESYSSALDRNLLYVACTRAMHELTLTCAGTVTRFVSDEALYELA